MLEEDYLVYINALGKNSEKKYVYEFYFGGVDFFWIVDADIKPASICNLGVPDEGVYSNVRILKCDIKLDLAKNNPCFSYQDCISSIIPVAWESLDGYEEYPENGRLILPFGLSIDDVEKKLSVRDLSFE